MHDEIVTNFRAPEFTGQVRLGSPDDYALVWLPEILAGFAEAHPAVEVEVVCLPSSELLERYERGDLDLTLFSYGTAKTPATGDGSPLARPAALGRVGRPLHPSDASAAARDGP